MDVLKFTKDLEKKRCLLSSHSQGKSDMWQCPLKIGLVQWKIIHYWTKWPVGIWEPPLWSIWMSCKLDDRSSNLYSFTGPNVHSTSIYFGKHYWAIYTLSYSHWNDWSYKMYLWWMTTHKNNGLIVNIQLK